MGALFPQRPRLISVDYPQIGLKLDYSQAATNGTYVGLDRFGRIADQYWKQTSADIDRFKYEYDYASSPKFKDNLLTNDRDQLYAYDGLHRLTTYDQGQLDSGAIASPTAQEDWTLDALGNWKGYVTQTGTTVDLNQTRDFNAANEIDAPAKISQTVGAAWYDPAYDSAGNMIIGPAPAPYKTFQRNVTYDAWNRVIEVKFNNSLLLEKYEYDGLNRRIVRTPGSGDILHSYYTEGWQELEVRKESGSEDPDPFEQFVWHPYYIDALATRFYDENVDGASVAQHYFTHDANFNMTAAVTTTPAVAERYDYTPYGSLKFLDSAFAVLTYQVSTIGNAYTYTGRRFDGATGLYYYRHRNYDPDLGNFLNRDPIGYSGSPGNLFAYVGSNPIVGRDYSGLELSGWGNNRRPSNSSKDLDSGYYLDSVNAEFYFPSDPMTQLRQLCRENGCPDLADELHTTAFWTFVVPGLPNRCEAWVFTFEERLRKDRSLGLALSTSCIKETFTVVRKSDRSRRRYPRHAWFCIVFINDRIVCFDNGADGGMFFLAELPEPPPRSEIQKPPEGDSFWPWK